MVYAKLKSEHPARYVKIPLDKGFLRVDKRLREYDDDLKRLLVADSSVYVEGVQSVSRPKKAKKKSGKNKNRVKDFFTRS